MPRETIPYLQLFSVASRTEARINDIPVVRAHAGEQKTSTRPIREYVLPGRNTVELRASPPEGQTFGEHQELHLRVAEFEEGDWLEFDGGTEFASLRPALNEQTPAPLQQGAEFHSDHGQPWAWSRGPVLKPAEHHAALESYVGQLSSLFASRDAEGLFAQTLQRAQEDTASYPAIPLEERRANFHSLFNGPAEWHPVPFDPSRITYRTAAYGRLVEILDPEGHPFLRTRMTNTEHPHDDPDYVEVPVMVGILQGRFAVLR